MNQKNNVRSATPSAQIKSYQQYHSYSKARASTIPIMTDTAQSLKTKDYPIESLIFAEYNPRQLTKDQHKDLTDSIKRFGLVDPLIINTHKDRKNILIGGHQRCKIAKELKYKTVPCVEVSLTPDKERELNIRLNRNTGEWDWDALANYFDVEDLTDWGFTDDELQFWGDEPTQGLIDDDEIPEVEEAVTKSGDLWLLGEHRVLCGDATKKEDVEMLMDGEKVDMVFTDPPYGIEYKSNWSKKFNVIKNDDEFLDIRPVLNEFCNDICPIYIWTSHQVFHIWREMFSDMYKSTIIWYKKFGGMGDLKAEYGHNFEICLYLTKNRIEFVSDRPKAVWEIGGDNPINYKHPTQKPVELSINAISHHNSKNVLDLFLGSGSTLIACEKTNRKCYGMEIDPHYCDVIVKRWEDYTGNKAERFEAANA